MPSLKTAARAAAARRPRKRNARRTVRRREWRTGLALTLAFAALVFGGFTWGAPLLHDLRGPGTGDASARDSERRRAAVLFVPLKGNICRQRVIDNETWLIADAGFVTCDEAVTWNSHYPHTRFQFTERIEQLKSGFRSSAPSK
jgi:hypothetical protein